jgi:biopolymer transport protein ExbD
MADLDAAPVESPAAAPRMGRRRRRGRRPSEGQAHININSLLDVLSVIVVFLMKSYSADVVQVKPSADLQVPFSHAAEPAEQSTAITITRQDILVDDRPVLHLEDGHAPAAARQADGMTLEALRQRLEQDVEQQKKIAALNPEAPFRGIATIIADRRVPYPLLTQVMYTAGLAQYGTFKFAAIHAER